VKELKSWYEDDHFWQAVLPIMFGEQLVTQAALQVDRFTKLLGLNVPATVLDLCCGLGRHSSNSPGAASPSRVSIGRASICAAPTSRRWSRS
jgi:hypothetical protein